MTETHLFGATTVKIEHFRALHRSHTHTHTQRMNLIKIYSQQMFKYVILAIFRLERVVSFFKTFYYYYYLIKWSQCETFLTKPRNAKRGCYYSTDWGLSLVTTTALQVKISFTIHNHCGGSIMWCHCHRKWCHRRSSHQKGIIVIIVIMLWQRKELHHHDILDPASLTAKMFSAKKAVRTKDTPISFFPLPLLSLMLKYNSISQVQTWHCFVRPFTHMLLGKSTHKPSDWQVAIALLNWNHPWIGWHMWSRRA